ncbi:MAG TPA: tetratricopeptide repeat protein [Terriglobales bacterium]|nr:tetratricopeptide repeat protein [Terriglobales bacterium]
MFTVLTSINACGYDQELNGSDPLRAQVRSEVAKAVQASEETKEVAENMCNFYRDHQQPDASRDLAQYVSLSLYLGDAPGFAPKVKDTELPPDAGRLIGFVPFMQKFYASAGLHEIWQRHQAAYSGFTEQYHQAVAKMLFDTEIYLKMPSSGYVGRQFTVYLDAMGAPSQTNARNYGTDYYVVISPAGSGLKMQQIRHTYLHYLLDALALKNGAYVVRLEPLLDSVKTAPLEEGFKNDVSLLVTECLVRAIEARTMGNSKTPESERTQVVEKSEQEGYILTSYFYNALMQFEKEPTGMRNAYAEILGRIDIGREKKHAAQIEFAQQATPELLHLSRPNDEHLLLTAERRLSVGDAQAAQKLAQQALDENREDPGRALFILAQVATVNRDMQGARSYFEKALQVAQEPKVIAWSHIYLGRIFDLQENREAAVDHYRAALTAGNSLPEAKAAAERGLKAPYEPPASRQ